MKLFLVMYLRGHSDEFPGQQTTLNVYAHHTGPSNSISAAQTHRHGGPALLEDNTPTLEKSNVMILGKMDFKMPLVSPQSHDDAKLHQDLRVLGKH